MGILIGMDEAGFGPNLGPLVITATVWDVPGPPAECDLWELFSEAVTPAPNAADGRLHLADSKQVYSPATGMGRLEETVLSALELIGAWSADFGELCRHLLVCDDNSLHGERCLAKCVLPLPHVWRVQSPESRVDGEDRNSEPRNPQSAICNPPSDRWRRLCETVHVRLRAICSDIVWPRRWNRLNEQNGNKAATLSRLSLQLLRRVWEPDGERPALIVADKHGGRNRYDLFLQEICDGEMIFRRQESREISRYRIGMSEIQFARGGESHLPVALASMVSKYVRELSMLLFNRFWAAHVPGLTPTKGYPGDAKRFRREIAEAQRRLGITDEELWRER